MRIKQKLGIYIHIPFCMKKCNYCDFLSFPGTEQAMDQYVAVLIKQLQFYGPMYKDYYVSSIFFGGGTPSILPASHIATIMSTIYKSFDVDANAEITIECNPGTIHKEKLSIYKQSNINRISLGLQSTNNEELKFLGRIHTYEDFLRSFDIVRECGFANINIDLMSALPYQTLATYEESLKKVISLKPQHISAYSLIIEEGTPFESLDTALLPSEDEEREMYYMTRNILEAQGYYRYEISNYSLEGYECKHNSSYWTRDNYLGVGLGSSSLIKTNNMYEGYKLPVNKRFKDYSDMETYMKGDFGTYEELTTLSPAEIMEEFMFLGLRLTKGISSLTFREQFGVALDTIYSSVIDELTKNNLITYKNNILKLTDLGVDLSNLVLAKFLNPKF